ncbi:MAG TPA: nitrite/sulfite reductase [Polyangiaceae bacterium]|jgi:sulfite reductase (NADPH) hemoprotein beta-component|nr:nitrite/sulfite reductase [Polyangiaceae bacterium]
MYQYDSYDQAIVDQRARQFKGQVDRRLDGEITELEFKPLRLQNGLYMQLHGYMLRVAIPYGLLSSTQLRKLAHIATVYDKGYGHFTTRQNLQYNWLKLTDMPTILAELASVQMHGIQTSGNCIRNTTSDPFAGVAPDELEDPRPYCELIRQWSTFHPEFAFLPRKFKIAVTGTPAHDRAAIRFHDIGVRIVQNAAGERGFEIWVGGGLGRTPFVAKVVRPFLPYAELLSYLEAILRVYNLYGRRDNKFKARIKILVSELGIEKFTAEVEKEWEQLKGEVLQVTQAEIDRIKAQFQPPKYKQLPAMDLEGQKLKADRSYAKWLTNNVQRHKQPGYSIVVLSLKAKDTPPGDVSDSQMLKVADLADQYSLERLVVTHSQNLVLTDVETQQLPALYAKLVELDMATPNFERVTDAICCPGLDYCSLANARSIPVSLAIAERFADIDFQDDIGRCSIKISGCINACGHHHIGNIGILGIDKHGEEAYQLMLGGCESDSASIGKVLGPAFKQDEVVDAVDSILRKYLQIRTGQDETFLECFRRLGMQPFKDAAYASHQE